MAGGTIGQPYIFAAALWAGMAAGVLYAALGILRRALHCGRAANIFVDILFIAASLAAACVALFFACKLSLRPYHFFGLFCGFALFELAVTPAFSLLFRKLFAQAVDKRSKKGCNKTNERTAKGRGGEPPGKDGKQKG